MQPIEPPEFNIALPLAFGVFLLLLAMICATIIGLLYWALKVSKFTGGDHLLRFSAEAILFFLSVFAFIFFGGAVAVAVGLINQIFAN